MFRCKNSCRWGILDSYNVYNFIKLAFFNTFHSRIHDCKVFKIWANPEWLKSRAIRSIQPTKIFQMGKSESCCDQKRSSVNQVLFTSFEGRGTVKNWSYWSQMIKNVILSKKIISPRKWFCQERNTFFATVGQYDSYSMIHELDFQIFGTDTVDLMIIWIAKAPEWKFSLMIGIFSSEHLNELRL